MIKLCDTYSVKVEETFLNWAKKHEISDKSILANIMMGVEGCDFHYEDNLSLSKFAEDSDEAKDIIFAVYYASHETFRQGNASYIHFHVFTYASPQKYIYTQ